MVSGALGQLKKLISVTLQSVGYSWKSFLLPMVTLVVMAGLFTSIPQFSLGILDYWFRLSLTEHAQERNLPSGLFRLWEFPTRAGGSVGRVTGSDPNNNSENILVPPGLAQELLEQTITQVSYRVSSFTSLADYFYGPRSFSRIGFLDFLGDPSEQLVSGKIPQPIDQERLVYEQGVPVIQGFVTENTFHSLGIQEGSRYRLAVRNRITGERNQLYVEITGVFRPRDLQVYATNDDLLVVPWQTLEYLVQEQGAGVQWQNWNILLDFSRLHLGSGLQLLDQLAQFFNTFHSIRPNIELRTSPLSVFYRYADMVRDSNRSLTLFYLPALSILGLYGISVFRAFWALRRPGYKQLLDLGVRPEGVLASLSLEAFVMGLPALVFGPLVGRGFALLAVSSRGFLDFVNRPDMVLGFTGELWRISLGVVAGAMVLWFFAGMFLVQEWSFKGQGNSKVIILLLMSVFAVLGIGGYWYLRTRQPLVDPASDVLTFFVPLMLVVLGVMVLLLSMAYLLPRFVMLGNRRNRLGIFSLYIRRFNRKGGLSVILMIHLGLTIGLGFFSSTLARTYSHDLISNIAFTSGAPIVLQVNWAHYALTGSSITETEIQGLSEPPFGAFEQAGFIGPARVLIRNTLGIEKGAERVSGIQAQFFHPQDLYPTMYYQYQWLPHHLQEYMNLLVRNTHGVFVSEDLYHRLSLGPGDQISLHDMGLTGSFIVLGSIPRWPTMDPDGSFVIGNLNGYLSVFPRQPYAVWAQGTQGSMAEVLEHLRSKDIYLTNLEVSEERMFRATRTPELLQITGTMGLSFLMAVFITGVSLVQFGYLRWNYDRHNRGILLALGFSRADLNRAESLETLSLVLAAFGGGFFIARLVGNLVLPWAMEGAQASVPLGIQNSLQDGMVLTFVVLAMVEIDWLVRKRLQGLVQIGSELRLTDSVED